MKMAGHILPFSSQHFQRGNPLLGGGRGRDPGSQSKCFKKRRRKKRREVMLNLSSKLKRFSFMTVFTIDHHIRLTEQLKNDSLSVCNKGDGGLFEKRNLIQFKWWRVNDECESLHSCFAFSILYSIEEHSNTRVFQSLSVGFIWIGGCSVPTYFRSPLSKCILTENRNLTLGPMKAGG